MKQVKKGIILAAGMGTRMLPATKSVPKELFPIVDKPAIQYLVEELVASGIEDIMIVISRGKTLIEDHFDKSPELEEKLENGGKSKEALLEEVRKISDMANIIYVRQKVMNGTGGALQMARHFTGSDPFAVLYGDDVIINHDYPVTKQLVDAYNEFGLGVAGVQEVSEEAIQKYSTMKVENIRNNLYKLTDMIEKPTKEQILSLYAILGRLIMPAEIYDILDRTPLGAGNELQLTDAMKILANTKAMTAVDFIGRRYDMGNKFGVMQAQVEQALVHPEIKDEFRVYLKEIAKEL
ncbi:MAG: UTP--glucose-1-phosphate uridylyltransferase [Clostridiales bacterium]|nr:MAG: UTP--glucose-1-phosphate uridylyltransferase [Clostridiales bacterium]